METEQTKEINPIFNHENTVSQSAAGIERLFIMQELGIINNRLRFYFDQQEGSGTRNHALRKVRSAIRTLYEELHATLKEKKREEYLKELEKLINEDPIKAYRLIREFLTKDLKLIKIDNMIDYDKTKILQSNKVRGVW